MQLYFSRDDLKIRIEEIRRMKQIFTNEEDFLILQYQSLDGVPDCFVNLKGQVVGPDGKKPKTNYVVKKEVAEDREGMKRRMAKQFGVPAKSWS